MLFFFTQTGSFELKIAKITKKPYYCHSFPFSGLFQTKSFVVLNFFFITYLGVSFFCNTM